MKIAFFFVVFFLSQLPALAESKKTVCSMTLNSPDEINVFKKMLPQSKFNFVELVDPNSETWLKDSCSKNISCDILIISGHFGGTFFGETETELSLESLEQASCEKSCAGILKNPKEVFLFGCNTLAGKDQDRRTPEQYRQVLLSDGFSFEQASMITAFRYSPFGSTFSDRMRRVFSNTPQIYGFSSIAPSGQNVEGMLKDYLKSTASDYFDRLVAYSRSKNPEAANKTLAKKLKDTTFIQTSGDKKSSLPICYLSSKQVTQEDKFQWIQNTLNSDQFLNFMPDIGNFIEGILLKPKEAITEAEQNFIKNLSISADKKEKLLAFLKVREKAFIHIQVNVSQLLLSVGWISEKDHQELFSEIVLGDLSEWNWEKTDMIRSYEISFPSLSFDAIPDGAWENEHFLRALEVLQPIDIRFQKKLLDYAFPSPSQYGRFSYIASRTLGHYSWLDNQIILSAIEMLKHSDKKVQANGCRVISGISNVSTEVFEKLSLQARSESPSERNHAVEAFKCLGYEDLKVQQYLMSLFDIFPDLQLAISNGFSGFNTLGEETVESVARLMIKTTDDQILRNFSRYIEPHDGPNPVVSAATHKLLASTDPLTRVAGVRIFANNSFKSEYIISQILNAIITDQDKTTTYSTYSIEIADYLKLYPVQHDRALKAFPGLTPQAKVVFLHIYEHLDFPMEQRQNIYAFALSDPSIEVIRNALYSNDRGALNSLALQLSVAQLLNKWEGSIDRAAAFSLKRIKPLEPKVVELIKSFAASGNKTAQQLLRQLKQ